MHPIIIVGTGLAGYNLAKAFRKQDQDTPLVMITADDGRHYSKPMLSTGFSKGKSADELAMAEAATMAAELNASILTHTGVQAIDPEAHQLKTDGRVLTYSKLVLATGAAPIRLALEGDATDAVFSINDLTDYDRFRAALPESAHVAIMGAGLIGCEFANDLHAGGYQTTVVAPSSQVMPGLLPTEAAGSVQSALETLGVNFRLGRAATGVFRAGERVRLALDNGDSVSADIVISAVGLRPRTQLAEKAGLAVGKGIVANQLLQTSHPDIFAMGDCAEVDGHVLLYVMPLMSCARALAQTLAGEPTAVSYGPMPVTVKTPACPVVTAPPAVGARGQWVLEQGDAGVKALYQDGDTLHGYALTGEAVREKLQLNRRIPPVFS
ncbi:NAD(P)/FAD-dependent oxidoreductase [Kistimonas asteriae]|uniref:NAD(P)/FAD-dependent oxidoreductase n=1 Tax=Kistimonas asteriae TaxID=517724 RepID=UPI001BA5922A|nr:FAD-dependent oxidoreductase [Kistimonas asteriae]